MRDDLLKLKEIKLRTPVGYVTYTFVSEYSIHIDWIEVYKRSRGRGYCQYILEKLLLWCMLNHMLLMEIEAYCVDKRSYRAITKFCEAHRLNHQFVIDDSYLID